MQFSLMNFEIPICIDCFFSTVSGRRAPLGQTRVQMVQSKLQYPERKFIRGCMMPETPNAASDGTNTPDGQALTQRWQAVQVDVKRAMLDEPGGEVGDETGSGIFVGRLCFFWGWSSALAARLTIPRANPKINPLRPRTGCFLGMDFRHLLSNRRLCTEQAARQL